MQYSLSILPSGHLGLYPEEETGACDIIWSDLENSFSKGDASGLLFLANEAMLWKLPPVWIFWRRISMEYMHQFCLISNWNLSDRQKVLPPAEAIIQSWVQDAPPQRGIEYLNEEMILQLWSRIDDWTWNAFVKYKKDFKAFAEKHFPNWHNIGRVTFHLAENKGDPDRPFAFMATYSNSMSEKKGKVQYLPLARALQQYAGAKNSKALVSLLSPVRLAAEKSALARNLVDTKRVFKPLAWTPKDAYRFLKDIPLFEESGLVVKVPDWWAGKNSLKKPQVKVTIGEKKANAVGHDALLDFNASIALGDETLTQKEWKQISNATDGLVLLKGRWVEVNAEQLKEALEHWKEVESAVGQDGISFVKAMRLLSGAAISSEEDQELETTKNWSEFIAGTWLKKQLEQLQNLDGSIIKKLDGSLNAELRPYQETGAHWLWSLDQLGLGACLADDMGLGKTIQVLSLLLLIKSSAEKKTPSLLIVPTSLVANWKSEIQRFANTLKIFIAHTSEVPADSFKVYNEKLETHLSKMDLVITTYGQLSRLNWLQDRKWRLVVLDEAQAIKNPDAKQTRAIKKLQSKVRIALTGTPVENRLSDLWSLFDFVNPGLLGNRSQFKAFAKRIDTDGKGTYHGLRKLVSPYILRRLKTDKSIIQDLPDKTEMKTFCNLSKKQTVLYENSVAELAKKLHDSDGIQRRGLVLAFLMRFKQICNHPSQILSDDNFQATDSGKFLRIHEICEELASRQEKVIIFTQFKAMTQPLEQHLQTAFNKSGLILHGGTTVKKRKEYVDAFQDEKGPPFFILSLKAGGTGLNLTAASHVIHFDRWWNPAVENQATDRAFRIGQKKNVMVHKFVCRGTVEEKIDAMIAEKQALSDEILTGGTERLLTEMDNKELLDFVSLDINSALNER